MAFAAVAPVEVQQVKFDDVKVGKYNWNEIEVKMVAPTSSMNFVSKISVMINLSMISR